MARHTYPGVYAITHIASGRRYIGSALNIDSRWRFHRSCLNRGIHHSGALQALWSLEGIEAFRLDVLDTSATTREGLYDREQHWLDRTEELFNTYKHARPGLDHYLSDEGRKRLSERMRGNQIGKGRHHGPVADETVREIFRLRASGLYEKEVSARLGVPRHTVAKVLTRSIYQHVPVPAELIAGVAAMPKRARGERSGQSKLSAEKVRVMRERLAAGENVATVARDYGVSAPLVSQIKLKRAWRHV